MNHNQSLFFLGLFGQPGGERFLLTYRIAEN